LELTGILSMAYKILLEVPLCDRCLGRLFARLGLGLSNRERGEALKLMLTMELHKRLKENGEVKEEYIVLAKNMCYQPLFRVLREYGVTIEECSKCRICGDNLERLIENSTHKIVELLREFEVENFLVGVTIPREMAKLEEEIIGKYSIDTYESIKNEIKREVGKRVRDITGLRPEFQKPHIVFNIDFESGEVKASPTPLLIEGRYWKLGRNISQVKWILRDGSLKYPLSVEEALQPIAKIMGGSLAVLHAAGREDVDARMLGSGRPAIVEVKEPRKRSIDRDKIVRAVIECSKGFVKFVPKGIADRERVEAIKEGSKVQVKLYRALIVSNKKLNHYEVEKLKEKFKNITISQRTPIRVLHRRPDIVRVKSVYNVNVKLVSENVMEAIIECEGGLYIKELISGDEGRTTPSFSEVLGANLKCVELDVLGVK